MVQQDRYHAVVSFERRRLPYSHTLTDWVPVEYEVNDFASLAPACRPKSTMQAEWERQRARNENDRKERCPSALLRKATESNCTQKYNMLKVKSGKYLIEIQEKAPSFLFLKTTLAPSCSKNFRFQRKGIGVQSNSSIFERIIRM